MVRFTDEPVRTRQGAPRVHIPDEIAEWCEHTYEANKSCEIPVSRDDPETPTIIRALRIYATRQDKSISYEFVTLGKDDYLRFRMRDKQTQRRAPLPKEK